jgi:membrane protease YdiL (CAAX protease family)
MEEKQSIFKKIHTDRFRWNDFFIIPMFLTYIMIIAGQVLGQLIIGLLFGNAIAKDETGFLEITTLYLLFIGMWIITLLCIVVSKGNKPILKALWTAPKGNNVKYLLLGLLIGFITNMICAITAMINKDISIYYDSFPFLQLVIIFIAVFIQSSAEELVCRGFLYYRLRRGYRHPAVAIVLNALLFAFIHVGNPGVSNLALLDIFITGIFFSLMVYYLDSIWCAMAAHAAWNYTQNIILGLPNSGIVSPFSIFKLDAASATDSFAYSVAFGLEGTILSTVVMAAGCVVLYVLFHNKEVKAYDPWN